MRNKTISCMLLFTSLASMPFAPGSAAAGDTPRGTAYAGAGWGNAWSDESNIGAGATWRAGIEIGVLRGLALGGSLSRYHNERRFASGVVFAGDGTILSGDVVYRFGSAALTPFVLGGLSWTKADRESRFPGGDVVKDDSSGAGVHGGGGVEIALGSGLALRPELRLVLGKDTWHVSGSGALAVRW